jgi:hypothetical protein
MKIIKRILCMSGAVLLICSVFIYSDTATISGLREMKGGNLLLFGSVSIIFAGLML